MNTAVQPKVKKSIFKRWWFWLIVVVVILAAAGKGRGVSKVTLNLPADEQNFINAVAIAQGASNSAQNDMQRGSAKATRDQAICSTLKPQNLVARNWTGTVKKITSNSEGKGVLEVEISPDVLVKTTNNAVSDSFFGTLMDPSNPVFQIASGMKPGQAVTFSGNFFPDIGKTECVEEGSLTLIGKLEGPEFIFKFSALAPYQAAASTTTSSNASPAPSAPPIPPAPAAPAAAPAPQINAIQVAASATQPTAATPAAPAPSQSSGSGELTTGSDQPFSTVAGILKTQQPDGGDRQILLNGKPLFQGSDAQWQQPVAKFALSSGRDAVLVASSGGRGNSCEVLYYFALLSKDAQPKWTPEFGTCSPGGRYAHSGDTVTLTIPALGKMETSVFDGNQVVEDGKTVAMVDSQDPSK
ncbi:hypothetical protein SRS16CHR_04304 [Variovorax sp. SRS16]|uniref:hypothetical protein n=1 Tax=Variovorax sp. SRS16 TaxID=282217 RepID=UPI0013162AAD|nr:hypothetical protein [Variovorax sp. SRS16]VTU28628.1 hypothetical protein SRS16CHR_04304 [Variovorax sp. SRS16]